MQRNHYTSLTANVSKRTETHHIYNMPAAITLLAAVIRHYTVRSHRSVGSMSVRHGPYGIRGEIADAGNRGCQLGRRDGDVGAANPELGLLHWPRNFFMLYCLVNFSTIRPVTALLVRNTGESTSAYLSPFLAYVMTFWYIQLLPCGDRCSLRNFGI